MRSLSDLIVNSDFLHKFEMLKFGNKALGLVIDFKEETRRCFPDKAGDVGRIFRFF
jgi:hypothetical protein